MKNKNNSNWLKYLDDDVACAYETRIPQGNSSRNLAIIPFGFGVVACGMGVFMADHAAVGKVAFWDNLVVWFGLGLALYCISISIAMTLWKWKWTAVQMGLMSICAISFYYSFSMPSIVSTVLYGDVQIEIRFLIFLFSLVFNLYWVVITIKKCRVIWGDESLRGMVWIHYKNAVVHRQSGAKAAMDQVGLKIHPPVWAIIGATLLIIPFYPFVWSKNPLFFQGIHFVHVVAIIAQVVTILGLIASVMSFMLVFYYPAKIQRMTGKPVLIDMMAPAKAPIPSRGLFE